MGPTFDRPAVAECSKRRCEHSAEIMRIRNWLQRRGYLILDVTPVGVVAVRGLGGTYCYTPDDRAPTLWGRLAEGPVRDGPILPGLGHRGGVVADRKGSWPKII